MELPLVDIRIGVINQRLFVYYPVGSEPGSNITILPEIVRNRLWAAAYAG
ncbi:MAG: hypothetical protein KGJ62_11540 [Armatimonadetes bacterium]|nr:hypothetical protein [Armatimonadota bacterium]MDE2206494.1 hypothetical protein [Armatimonadota bacterium]